MRTYGKKPISTFLIHGGPGASGELEPVAKKLSLITGVAEPFQTALSIEGQIEELKTQIDGYSNHRVSLVGYSWGAMLGILFVARYANRVDQLILIGSGVLDNKYADQIKKTRNERLNDSQQMELNEIVSLLRVSNDSDLIKRLNQLMAISDCFEPMEDNTAIKFDYEIFDKIWTEATELRKQDFFVNQLERIKCDIKVIHGTYDPHPIEGVVNPLVENNLSPEVHLLEKCGHKPWIERYAHGKFYSILENVLND